MAEINHYLSEEDAFQLDTVAVRLVKTREPITSEEPLTSSDAVVRALAKEMSDYDREVVGVINFDSKMRPINVNFVSAGTLNSSIAHPRELMKSAILSNAASMMMIHNHPSQDVTPSKADVEITDKMMKICDVMNIPLLDHIIIGGYGEEYFSFADKKVMPVINTRYKDDYMKLDFPSVAENNNRSDEYVMEHNTAYKTSDGKDKSDKIKEINELKQSLETIQKTASELISSIESKIPEIRKNMQMNANVTESVTFVSEELSENESHELPMSGGVSEDEPDEQYGMVM